MKLSTVKSFLVGANTASLIRGADGTSAKKNRKGLGLSAAASAGGALIGIANSMGIVLAATPQVNIEGNAKKGIPGLIKRIGGFVAQIYDAISSIVTVIAILVIVVALLFRVFSQEPKTVQTANLAIKKAVVGWLIINTLGYFFSTGLDFTDKGNVDVSDWEKSINAAASNSPT